MPGSAGVRRRRRRSSGFSLPHFNHENLRRLRIRPALLGGGLAAVLAAALFAITVYEVAARDRIMPGVRAVGTPVGWMPPSEAAVQLGPTLQAFLDRPIQLRHQNRSWSVTARDLGLQASATDLAAAAYQVGRDGSVLSRLSVQFQALTGGASVSIASGVDHSRLDDLIARIEIALNRSPADARLGIAPDGAVDHVEGREGLALDVAASKARVLKTLADGGLLVDLKVVETPPSIPNELVQPAFAQVNRMLGRTDSPLTLTRGQQSWPLHRAEVASLLSIEGGAQVGQPATVVIDDRRLNALVQRLAADVDQSVQNARFSFNNGNLAVLRPSREGRTLDRAATAALIKNKLLAGDYTAELPVSAVTPTVSSEDPASLGIVERIDTASTSFAGSIPEKRWNIKLAAERLNGVVVPPGATFSFNKELGPTTLESGFQWGFGIQTGREGIQTIPSVGGGICQVATTLFQPVFWSGYPLEERYWHLYWIPAYTSRGMVGLDVTVDEDAKLDFRWTNPTNDYILIQSATDDTNVYFSLYGKKPPWKVEVSDPVITNRVTADPKPVREEEPTLAWGRTILVQPARDGFDASISRKVTPDGGGEPRGLRLQSKYQAVPQLTLVGTLGKPDGVPAIPPEAEPKPTEAAQPTGQGTDARPGQTAVPPPPPSGVVAPLTIVPGVRALSGQVAATPAPTPAAPERPTAAPTQRPQ